MPALITELIDLVENSNRISEQIAAILVVESENQQALARAERLEPEERRIRVFMERSNPWGDFTGPPEEGAELDTAPIVNVAYDNGNADRKTSDGIERTKVVGVWHLDCYGYGVATDDGTGGHDPGDMRSALEAQRAAALVRKILMSGHYAYLGFPRAPGQQFIWHRWWQGIQTFTPAIDGRPVERVTGVRVSFQVDFNEFSPQVQGKPLETIASEVTRGVNGQVLLNATYEFGVTP